MYIYALNDLYRSPGSQDMHIWAFGVEPERTCTSSYLEIPCMIHVGTFLGIFLHLDKWVYQKFPNLGQKQSQLDAFVAKAKPSRSRWLIGKTKEITSTLDG